ncbi:hypothetical protein EZS27_000984 [termite gut metagenome]|uniref:DUF6377 domain-containing protein n=1 Tax=termite gut metagenome TaxID=433724 RepID=A0A5J4T250_9ZZZZ
MRIKTFIFFLSVCITNTFSAQVAFDSLLNSLDKAISEHDIYSSKREVRINALKMQKAEIKPFSLEAYQLNMQLYKEYKAYICDSAIFYLNRNIEIGYQTHQIEHEYESKLLLSNLLGSSGMYKEAVDLLETIDRKRLPNHLFISYYSTYRNVYGELAFYTQDKSGSLRYRAVSKSYGDSLNRILPSDDNRQLVIQETDCRYKRNFAEARKWNDIQLSKVQPGTPEHAIIAFNRSRSYEAEGLVEEEKYWLALSALSNIQSATKDHASLWMLAQKLFREGDIERAYTYIRFSWSETVFYNARLRSLQSAGILSLIDQTYQLTIEKKNQQLQLYLILISALLLMLLTALGYIYRQMKKLSAARNNLQIVNVRLKDLNGELKEMNDCLQSINMDLSESNRIKEEYIGRFIKLCSTYIHKLDIYRRMVNKEITSGHIPELLKMTRSEDALNEELEELYTNFDSAFLRIFPDFVNQFNELLQDKYVIVLKKDELLNTELRIFALIRLGIDDSSQIAEFLHYSINTIYNYRAKIKNKASVSRDDFEKLVKMIR